MNGCCKVLNVWDRIGLSFSKEPGHQEVEEQRKHWTYYVMEKENGKISGLRHQDIDGKRCMLVVTSLPSKGEWKCA
eukprot:8228928-Karenia_brevis.AAC.1